MDSLSSLPVQMAPCAVQSVVTGSSTVTSAFPEGCTVTSQRRFLPLTSLRAPVTSPPGHREGVVAHSGVAEARFGRLTKGDPDAERVAAVVGRRGALDAHSQGTRDDSRRRRGLRTGDGQVQRVGQFLVVIGADGSLRGAVRGDWEFHGNIGVPRGLHGYPPSGGSCL